MSQCAKCGTLTEIGQLYRFYFGLVVDDPPEGQRSEGGPFFQAKGSEEVYFCDRCLIQATAREEMIRSAFFLVLGLFGILVAAFLALACMPAFWVSLVLLLAIAALGGSAFSRYWHLHAALRSDNPNQLRQVVSSNPKIQNRGDEWAIARRRQVLQGEGAELFLTRNEYEFWSSS
jgi:hypothetical protein